MGGGGGGGDSDTFFFGAPPVSRVAQVPNGGGGGGEIRHIYVFLFVLFFSFRFQKGGGAHVQKGGGANVEKGFKRGGHGPGVPPPPPKSATDHNYLQLLIMKVCYISAYSNESQL